MSKSKDPRLLVKAHLDPQLRQELGRLALEADRSIAAEIRRAVRAYVERYKHEVQP